MIAFGATEEQLEELRAEADTQRAGFALWPENAQAVEVFCGLGSQWRLLTGTGATYWQGLRYEAIEPVLRLMGVPRRDWPPLFGRLRVMEAAAREALNEKR